MSRRKRASKRPRVGLLPASEHREDTSSLIVEDGTTPGRQSPARTPSGVSLPLDVVYAISAFFQGDIESARSSAATCSSWYSLIRHRIYHTVKIIKPEQIPKLEQFLDAEPAACRWILDLHIGLLSQYAVSIKWFDDLVARIPSKLQRVYSLTLRKVHSVAWNAEDQMHFLRLLSALPTVRFFGLLGCCFHEQLLTSSLMAFKQLDHLDCDDVTTYPTHSNAQLAIPSSYTFQPRSFTYTTATHFYMNDSFLEILNVFTSFQNTLTTLELTVTNMFKHSKYSLMLRESCPHLRHLIIRCSVPDTWYIEKHLDVKSDLENLELSLATNLRTLGIHPFNHPATMALLPKLCSPHLEKVVFSLSFNWNKCLNAKKFSPVDNYLHRDVLRTLRIVKFLYTGPLDEHAVDAKIRNTFPKMNACGVLRVVKVKDLDAS